MGSGWRNQDDSVWRRRGSEETLLFTTTGKEVVVRWQSASSPR